MPQIRPIRYTDDLGNPVVGATIYVYEVGKAYTDPNALLTLTDAENGSTISNPFSTDANGFPINATTGARVNPFTTAQRWGLYGVNANGVEVYDLPVQVSDAYTTNDAAGEMVDASFNNFTDAKQLDLADYSFIFIKSQGSSGWENTANGPDKSFYAYSTGSTGSPSTGTPDLFYDSQGKEWAMADISSIPYTINLIATTPPTYADLSEINTAIPSPSNGMIVNVTGQGLATYQPASITGLSSSAWVRADSVSHSVFSFKARGTDAAILEGSIPTGYSYDKDATGRYLLDTNGIDDRDSIQIFPRTSNAGYYAGTQAGSGDKNFINTYDAHTLTTNIDADHFVVVHIPHGIPIT